MAQRHSRRTVLPCLCVCLPPPCLYGECVWRSVITRGASVDWQCRIPQHRPRTIAPPFAASQGSRPAIARQRREQTGLGSPGAGSDLRWDEGTAPAIGGVTVYRLKGGNPAPTNLKGGASAHYRTAKRVRRVSLHSRSSLR